MLCVCELYGVLSSIYKFIPLMFHNSTSYCCRDELVEKGNATVSSVWQESWTATKAVIKVPTFQIIVLQGIVGSLPWTAMVFFTMWFELIG